MNAFRSSAIPEYCLDGVRRQKLEVGAGNGADQIVEAENLILVSVVEESLKMPGLAPARTREAIDKKPRIG